jgi:molybdopterin-guanine dinucleotide biosynthesis protein A
MGRDKRKLRIGGKSFFEIAVENARSISDDVIVSLGSESQAQGLVDVRFVVDEEKRRGPLYALASTLKKCEKDYVAVLPVDAPLLKTAIYRLMKSTLERDSLLEAVIPLGATGPEPLHGVYRTESFLFACESAIFSGKERVLDAVKNLENVRFLELKEFLKVDPKLLSFLNINTPSDLKKLKRNLDV